MKLGKSVFYIFLIAMACITSLSSSGDAMKKTTAVIVDGDQERVSSSKVSNNPNFEDLGDKFHFISERGEQLERNVGDYSIVNQTLYNLVSKKKAIIFGGSHLNDRQAFELSKKYAKEGKLDLMMNAGVHLHEGHIVINTDSATCPDYKEDFTTSGLIKKLGLESQFEIATFENVKQSLTLCEESLMNAWDALAPGGRIIIYPAVPFFHETLLNKLGFAQFKFLESGYKDILTDRTLDFPACFAVKLPCKK